MMDLKRFKLVKTRYAKLLGYCVYLLLLIFPTCAVSEVISIFSPGQVERQLRNTVNIQQAVSARGPAIPVVAAPLRPAISVPPSMRRPFVLRSVCITGSTVYSQASLQTLVKPYLDKRITYKDLEKINGQIALKYLKDGYVLTKAYLPVQSLSSGYVHIEILEAYVVQVNMLGKTHGLDNYLDAYAKQLKRSRPLRLKVLQHYLLLLNRLPGVSASLSKGPDVANSGAQTLTFVVKQRRFVPNALLNNSQNRYLGGQNLFLTANMYSLLQGGDSTIVTAATAPFDPKVLQYYYLLHNFPIGVNGNHLDIYADYTQIKPSINLPPASVSGKAGDLGAYFYHPFILQTNDKLDGRLAFGYYRSKTSSYTGVVNSPDAIVRLPSLRAKAIYERTRTKYFDRMEAELSQGIHVFGANTAPPPPPGIPNPYVGYTKFYYYVTHIQNITQTFSILIDSMGQYAFNPLAPAEKIPYGGGLPYGQAYDPGEIIGDQGLMGGIELRYNSFPKSFAGIQYFTRYDIGKVWNKNVAPTFFLNSIYSDASLSAGLRLVLTKDFRLQLSVARPMTNPVQAQVQSGHNGKSLRFFFTFSYTPF
ncbi:ShlB/FhaC/HecB family hemolysin secretion/activation protein [Rickettsiella endosymbiont of Aleochara curtula]|uniref:ShlB/FhaC/HecB family hemolysin secretion/activation protein n=1 Tax=Rickettsiella endosymbiont of Aleochara curtula TaxID=3077936 RepID=UPI00313F1E78